MSFMMVKTKCKLNNTELFLKLFHIQCKEIGNNKYYKKQQNVLVFKFISQPQKTGKKTTTRQLAKIRLEWISQSKGSIGRLLGFVIDRLNTSASLYRITPCLRYILWVIISTCMQLESCVQQPRASGFSGLATWSKWILSVIWLMGKWSLMRTFLRKFKLQRYCKGQTCWGWEGEGYTVPDRSNLTEKSTRNAFLERSK